MAPSVNSVPEMVGSSTSWLESTNELKTAFFPPNTPNLPVSANNESQPLTPPDSLVSSVDFLSDSEIDQLLNDFDTSTTADADKLDLNDLI